MMVVSNIVEINRSTAVETNPFSESLAIAHLVLSNLAQGAWYVKETLE